jgi:hypothetical protein
LWERVGERVVAMLQAVFIKTDFIFYDTAFIFINVIPSFTSPLPNPLPSTGEGAEYGLIIPSKSL